MASVPLRCTDGIKYGLLYAGKDVMSDPLVFRWQ
jgi:hypothetical protein